VDEPWIFYLNQEIEEEIGRLNDHLTDHITHFTPLVVEENKHTVSSFTLDTVRNLVLTQEKLRLLRKQIFHDYNHLQIKQSEEEEEEEEEDKENRLFEYVMMMKDQIKWITSRMFLTPPNVLGQPMVNIVNMIYEEKKEALRLVNSAKFLFELNRLQELAEIRDVRKVSLDEITKEFEKFNTEPRSPRLAQNRQPTPRTPRTPGNVIVSSSQSNNSPQKRVKPVASQKLKFEDNV
jgi:hypothetical protein